MAEADNSLVARLRKALGSSYTIEGEIGRGGMGVVYQARDERLKRQVAIKVLPPELAFREEIRIRFLREAETAARLSHPHIVPIHSVGEGPDGLVYFVMAYVDGESLAARLKRRVRLPAEEARRVMIETADALGAAHAVGIIHRDVKPDNILLEGSRGRVVVTDFGIAKALSSTTGSATLTATGVAIGTPHYMSPEQAAGDREIDGRSDLYSLGVVSYQTLTGELPFSAPTVPGILMKHITEQAPRVVAKRPDCPPDLESCVMRCLEKDPEDRWPTADALRRSLEARTATAYQPRRPPAAGTRRYSGAPPLPAPPGPPAQRGRERDRRPATSGEFRRQTGAVQQARNDRKAILKILERVPKSEKKLLPDVVHTVDALLHRAEELARMLHTMSADVDQSALARLDGTIAATKQEREGPERERQLGLLARQRQTLTDLVTRRQLIEDQIESCVLAMQNVRFDLLRLRSAGVAAVLDDLTQATQQARALSRDVDHAIAAAGEIREALGERPRA